MGKLNPHDSYYEIYKFTKNINKLTNIITLFVLNHVSPPRCCICICICICIGIGQLFVVCVFVFVSPYVLVFVSEFAFVFVFLSVFVRIIIFIKKLHRISRKNHRSTFCGVRARNWQNH